MHRYRLSLLVFVQTSFYVAEAQIPLLSRSPPSGSVEDALPEMLARAQSKYGFTTTNGDTSANRHQGTGWVSLETGEVVDIGSKRRKRTSLARRQDGGKSVTESIVNLQHDTAYYAPVGVGTPPAYFNVLLDTGSSDLWVASKSCTMCPADTATFDPSTSSTFTATQKTLALHYGSGTVTGALGSDTITFPPTSSSDTTQFIVPGQTFGIMDNVSSAFLRPRLSGTLGLAFHTIANSNADPAWETLVKQGAWSEPLMAFYFSRHATAIDNHNGNEAAETGGQFTMGGTNTTVYTGDIDFVSLPQQLQTYWMIPLSAIHIDSANIDISNATSFGGQLAAIDTGTSLIGGPANVVSKIYANIKGALRGTGENSGYYSIPCNTSIPVSMTFTSRTWNISAPDLQFGPSDDPSGQYCVGAFFEIALGGPGQVQWIVGQAFLKNVYSVFRYNPAAVGFAQLSGVDGSLPFPQQSGISPSIPSSGTTNSTTTRPPSTSGGSPSASGSPQALGGPPASSSSALKVLNSSLLRLCGVISALCIVTTSLI